ncbi:MAG: D-alanine--D-alanine ligase [Bacilli bacterium]|nr:D-alanine--D-alanine ligase [Clostridium sp.]MDY2804310.1 D-alanine--D-alanine ligase [Bacilli bacterium]MED9979560.1 D-alanine--D-alanine ligase [Bacilli bacterium]
MKLSIGVIFGGRSLEHDLSVLTAIQAMDNIDKERYEVVPIYITKDLTFYSGGMLRYIDSYKDFRLIDRYAKKVNLINKNGKFILQTTGLIKRVYKEIHLAFPMVHGKYTEDGSIVGYLETLGIPVVGSDIYSSSLCQDKVFTKEVLNGNDIPVVDYVYFSDSDYKLDKEDIFKKIEELSYPLIIKPARLGSGIGIEIVNRKEELESSIEKAMKNDERVLVEEYIADRREFNMAVLLSKGKLIGSVIEEIIKDEPCNYYDKYRKDNEDDTFKRIFPADISKTLTEEIEKTSKKTYKVLALSGVARIDYVYDNKKKKLYVNEVNTIPNFFSHHLFDDKNIDYRELLGIMIKEAIDKIHKENDMVKDIEDNLFNKVTTKDIKEMK